MGHAGRDLGMTLDLGHCAVTSDLPVRSVVDHFADRLIHVHVADCPTGVHQHLPLGEAIGLVEAGPSSTVASTVSRRGLSLDDHRAPEALVASFRR